MKIWMLWLSSYGCYLCCQATQAQSCCSAAIILEHMMTEVRYRWYITYWISSRNSHGRGRNELTSMGRERKCHIRKQHTSRDFYREYSHPSGVDDLNGPVSGKCLWVSWESSCVPAIVTWVLSVQVWWHLSEGSLQEVRSSDDEHSSAQLILSYMLLAEWSEACLSRTLYSLAVHLLQNQAATRIDVTIRFRFGALWALLACLEPLCS